MKLALLSLLASTCLLADTRSDDTKRIQAATTVLSEFIDAKDMPMDLLSKAHCIAVVPGVKKAGFIVGGKYGKGIVVCRDASLPMKWSAPSMIIIEGGSLGLQIGGGETDVVLAIMNQSGEDKLMKDKFTIGGDASAMAGPVGRDAQAQTDAMMHAEILSWSRARGAFAGVSLEGASMRADNDDNKALYGHEVTQQQLLHGHVPPPPDATALYAKLNQSAPFKQGGGDR